MAGKEKKKSLLLLHEFEAVFSELESDEERGQLIMAIFAYDIRGEEPDFESAILRFAWRTHVRPKLDEMKESYDTKVQKLRNNANKRWQMQKDTNAKDDMQMDAVAEKPMQSDANARYKDKDKDKDKDKAIGMPREATQSYPQVNQSYPQDEAVTEAERYLSERIHLITQPEREKLRELVLQYGLDAFKVAVQIMQQRGGRSMKYLETVIKDPRPDSRKDEDVGLPEEVIHRVLS